MIGRYTTIGLSLLSVLVLCAVAPQAVMGAAGVNTTAFTCVPAPNGDFGDAHCDQQVPGKFAHQSIALNTQTSIYVTSAETRNSTKESTPTIIRGNPFSVKTNIQCNTGSGSGTITNTEPVSKQHKVTGEITTKIGNCEVKEPAKCTLKEITLTATFEGVEGLEGKEEMGLEFKQKGVEPLASITLEGSECVIKGKTFPMTGSLIATSGTGNDTKAQSHTGATLVYTEAMTSKTVTLGGKGASVIGIKTMRMAEKENPIALTTVT